VDAALFGELVQDGTQIRWRPEHTISTMPVHGVCCMQHRGLQAHFEEVEVEVEVDRGQKGGEEEFVPLHHRWKKHEGLAQET
jgi:hypothetical protein